jgi:hypothetical protein
MKERRRSSSRLSNGSVTAPLPQMKERRRSSRRSVRSLLLKLNPIFMAKW